MICVGEVKFIDKNKECILGNNQGCSALRKGRVRIRGRVILSILLINIT